MSRPICFVDCETTALGHFGRPWEIAIIRRDPGQDDVERLWHVQYSWDTLPEGSTPEALQVGGWAQRGDYAPGAQYRDQVFTEQGVLAGCGAEFAIARHVHRELEGAILVGVGVHFDAARLSAMFRRHGLPEEPWHYGILDLKAATWGYHWSSVADGLVSQRPALPMRSEALAEAVYGADAPDDDERHTALGDARWARRWFDALTGGAL